MQEKTEERPQSRDTGSIETSSLRPESRESNSRSGSDSFPSKRQRGAQDMLIARKQMDEAFSLIKNRFNREEKEKEINACDLYGQLLAEKLKPLAHIDDRLVLMNEIDNLVFKYTMNVRQRNSLPTTAYSPYMNQTQQVVYRQPANLPGSSTLLIPQPVASQTNIQNSQSIINYDNRTSTPFQDTNARNNCAVQINLPEIHLSPETANNYALYTSDNNTLYDSIPSTSKNQYKESEVGNDKKINIISQTIIPPRTYSKNIIKEAYNRCDDRNDDTDTDDY